MHVTPHTFLQLLFSFNVDNCSFGLFFFFFLLFVGLKMCFRDVLAFIYKFQIVLFFYILVNLNF